MLLSDIQMRATLPKVKRPIVSIGMGGIVRDAHFPAYKQAGFEVVGGYDKNREHAEKMAEDFNLPRIYNSLQEAFAEAPADAVFDLAVPGTFNLDLLQHFPDGSAVLMQKPMGDTLKNAVAIRDLCREKNLTAAVNFQMRFMPQIIAARDMIRRGLIGDLWDIEARMQVYTPWTLWPYLQDFPRMEIVYHSIHYVDLVRSFCGNPDGVHALSIKHPVSAAFPEARTTIALNYGNNPRATILTNHGHIYGDGFEQSYVKWEGSRGAIYVQAGLNMNYPRGKEDQFKYVLLNETVPRDELQWQTLDVPGSWFPDAFIGTMSSLQRYVNGEIDVLPTGVEDAVYTMATVEAAYEDSANGGTALPEI